MSERRQPELLPSAKHREGLREVAEGRPWNVSDMILSDLMQKKYIKREGIERVLTHKGKTEYDRLKSSGGTSALDDLIQEEADRAEVEDYS